MTKWRWRYLGAALFVTTGVLSPTVIRSTRAASPSTVVVGYDYFPSDLNPNLQIQDIRGVQEEGLVLHDASLKPVPAVAQSWEITNGGKTYTFHLRPNARFPDGTIATSADVVFNLQRYRQAYPTSAAIVTGVTAVDSETVRITLSQPQGSFMANGLPTIAILEKKVFASVPMANWIKPNWNTDFKIWPVGVSPWVVKEVVKGDHITYAANPYYYGGKPKIDELIMKVVPDDNSLFEQLQSGDVQATKLLPRFLSQVDKSRFTVYTIPGLLWYRLQPNLKKDPFFKDVHVRQALAYAINRAGIVQNVYNGYADVFSGGIPPALAAWYNPNVPNKYPYDPAKAKQLLAAAGWKPGSDGVLAKGNQRLAFTVEYNNSDAQSVQAVTIMQQNLDAVGMSVQLKGVENTVVDTDFLNSTYDALMVNFGDGAYPGFGGYGFVYGCKDTPQYHEFNTNYFCDPAMDPVMAQAMTATSLSQQKKIFAKLQVLLDQQQPWIYLYAPQALWITDKRITGFVPNPLDWSNFLLSSGHWSYSS